MEPLPGEHVVARYPADAPTVVLTDQRLYVRRGSNAVPFDRKEVTAVAVVHQLNPVATTLAILCLGSVIVATTLIAVSGDETGMAWATLVVLGTPTTVIGLVALVAAGSHRLQVKTVGGETRFRLGALRPDDLAELQAALQGA